MFHKVVAEQYMNLFSSIQSAIVAIPASGSPLLLWIRNQLLIWNYLALFFSSQWLFFCAQLFYNDGRIFVTFWQQMMALQPFL